jgi:hypothetical protein
MTQQTYKDCTITRTETTTGGHDGKPLRNVFTIEGRLTKLGHSPIITSYKEARKWINKQDDYADMKARMGADQ